jgi:hypothetical protein
VPFGMPLCPTYRYTDKNDTIGHKLHAKFKPRYRWERRQRNRL